MSHRHTCITLLIAASSFLSVSAGAEQNEPFTSGWYVGAGFSYNDIYIYDDACYGCYGSAEYGKSDGSGTLTAGFRATEYLAIEGTYISQSSLTWDRNVLMFDDFFEPYFVDAQVELTSYQVSVLGILSGRVWEGYLRLGLAFWDAQSDLSVTLLGTGATVPSLVDRSGEDFLFGIGGGRAFGDNWQIRLDYAFFAIDDALLGLNDPYEAYADYATLQIIKRFGSD